MANFRDNKALVRTALEQDAWFEAVEALDVPPLALINVLLACLPQGAPITERAANLLGKQLASLAANPVNMEQTRIFVRRLLWHMNEDSGNIGWGIPEALGEILAADRGLAEQFHRVLISYIMHRENANDNYCEQPIIRLACFGAVQRLAETWPDLAVHAQAALAYGAANDASASCRAAATKTLAFLEQQRPLSA